MIPYFADWFAQESAEETEAVGCGEPKGNDAAARAFSKGESQGIECSFPCVTLGKVCCQFGEPYPAIMNMQGGEDEVVPIDRRSPILSMGKGELSGFSVQSICVRCAMTIVP